MHKKVMVICFVTLALACFVLKLILYYHFMDTSPQTPNIATNQVYPLNNHGYIFYVTMNQNLWQDILWYAFFVFGLAGGILEARWKTIRTN
jgi:hypothetical protein